MGKYSRKAEASGKATSPAHFKELLKDSGKGDDPRPLSVSKKEFARRWDKIFNNEEGDDGG